MVRIGTILYLFGLTFCIQNGETGANPVLFVTPSSVIAPDEYGLLEDAASKQKRDTQVIFVTPFSTSKRDSDPRRNPNEAVRTPTNANGNPSEIIGNTNEAESIPRNPVKVSASRKSRRSPKKTPPPATSYGTPYHDYYDLPPSKYGPPDEEGDEEEEEEATTTEAPAETAPPEEPHDFKGYDYSPPEEKIIVNKDIYFYKPGPDFTEPPPTPKPIKLPPPRKNYKVIFVKAPTFVSPPQIVPVVPQVEDKTLLYVLVKKPEEQPEIVVPTPAPTKPAPPEVYYVKYETKREEVKEPPKVYGPPPKAYGPPEGGEKGDPPKAKRKSKRSQRRSRRSDRHVQGFVPYVQRRRAYE